MIHVLKTWPRFWELTRDGHKLAEVRRDDRGFKRGDTVLLVNTATDEEQRFRIGQPTAFTEADLMDMWNLACTKVAPAPLVIFDLYDPDTWDEMGMDDADPG